MVLQLTIVAKAAMGVLSVGVVAIGLYAVIAHRASVGDGANETNETGSDEVDSQDRSVELYCANELGLRELPL